MSDDAGDRAGLDLLPHVPPNNADMEASALGAVLLDNVNLAIWEVAAIVQPAHFYRSAHAQIFEAMLALAHAQKPVDILTVKNELQRRGTLEAVGGAAYLIELGNVVPSAANATYYASVVRDLAALRSLARAGADLVRDAYEATESPAELRDRAEAAFLAAVETTDGSSETAAVIAERAIARIQSPEPETVAMPTGLVDVDQLLAGGLRPGRLVIVAGRPSMGKSCLGLQLALHAAGAGRSVAFFSLEVERADVVANAVIHTSGVNSDRLQANTLTLAERAAATEAFRKVGALPLVIGDVGAMSIFALRAAARQARARGGLDLVVVDYLQMMVGDRTRRDENKQQEISTISRGLKHLARELKIPVVALSQLSRAVESRDGNKPRLSDLRESGAIEQDADVVLMLYREEYYRPEKAEAKGKAEVIVAKNRNGRTGTVVCTFQPDRLRFTNYCSQQEGPRDWRES